MSRNSSGFTKSFKRAIIFLLQISYLLIAVNCHCHPEYFNYYFDKTRNEVMGIIKLPNPPQEFPLRLQMVLRVDTVLHNHHKFHLNLANSSEESIRAVYRQMPLYYKIYFPIQSPIPRVTMIKLNDVDYCVESKSPDPKIFPRTIITLINDFNAPMTDLPIKNESDIQIPDFSTTTTTSAQKTTTTTTTTTTQPYQKIATISAPEKSDELVDSSCGLTNPSIDEERLRLPWLVAIFFMEIEGKAEFQCSGTLLSKQHVLTTASCLINKKGEDVTFNIIYVSLGRFDIRDWDELGSKTLDISDYMIHPDFKNSESADSDLAIIKISEPVDYTLKIRPLCLWMGKKELHLILGKTGYVIGWEHPVKVGSSKPRMMEVSIVSQDTCLESNEKYYDIMSLRTFCAKDKDINELRKELKEDCEFRIPGSGLVFLDTTSGRYHLRGIRSSSLNLEYKSCYFRDYIVYVDVTKYLKWIRELLNS